MPQIRPIAAIQYADAAQTVHSNLIAPPYDVLNEDSKAELLDRSEHNIVAVDLPHLPAKTVGPDRTYAAAGERYREWLKLGVLVKREKPAMFAYQQTYTVTGRTFKRRGLMTSVQIEPFGRPKGIHPHEQTFSGPKEDRLKLMRATRSQLSPIFGLYSDPDNAVNDMLSAVIDASGPQRGGTTFNDDVLHELWDIEDAATIERFSQAIAERDVFIADGHHRYNTAMNYRQERIDTGDSPDAAQTCLFVLVAMQDPGMIVLPTHRVLGGMASFSFDKFVEAAAGRLKITPFEGTDLAALEKSLPTAGLHAIGFYNPANPAQPLAIATTVESDPLAQTHGSQSEAWRQLDVAIVQHLIVEGVCRPTFLAGGGEVTWKFPHSLEELRAVADGSDYQLGVVVQATPLDSVRQVSEAGELMPQKSTFFYPKVATGLVINPLD